MRLTKGVLASGILMFFTAGFCLGLVAHGHFWFRFVLALSKGELEGEMVVEEAVAFLGIATCVIVPLALVSGGLAVGVLNARSWARLPGLIATTVLALGVLACGLWGLGQIAANELSAAVALGIFTSPFLGGPLLVAAALWVILTRPGARAQFRPGGGAV